MVAHTRTQTSTSLETGEITRLEELPALVTEWSRLWSACPDASVFLLPDWQLPFWSRFAPTGLWLVTVRRRGGLVGLAPLFTHEEAGGRRLMLLGTGLTDHLDILASPEHADEVAEAVLRYIAAQPERWDTADFQQLPPDSPLLRAVMDEACSDTVREQDVCPVLRLPEHADDLPSTTQRHAHQVQYYRRRLERQARVTYEQATERSFETLYDALLDLHSARWHARGGGGVLADEPVRQFHREAAWMLLRRGMLRLHALRIDGRIAACFYGFHANGRTSYYLGGFDPAMARLNVGTLMVAHAIDCAVEEGAVEFDFLRGREPYKYAWGAQDTVNMQRVLRRIPAGRGDRT